MSRYWSKIVQRLVPYVPGEQAALANPVKLNTNENPYLPSLRVVAAIAQELGGTGESLRRYFDWGGSGFCRHRFGVKRIQTGV